MSEEKMREVILRILGRIAPEANLKNVEYRRRYRDQFDFDSVDFLNFAIALQEELKITIPELDYPKLATLQSCTEYLASRMSAPAPPANQG
jgi:acyl carrier protein